MTAWVVVAAVGAVTVCFKAAGPVLLGQRPLPRRARSVVELLAPVMLTALVVGQTVGGERELVLDARLPAVGAAGLALALWRRLPVVAAMALAASVAAALRLLG